MFDILLLSFVSPLEDTLNVLFQLYELLRSQQELCHTTLVGITQMASISGKIFAEESSRLAYVSKLLVGILQLLQLASNHDISVVEVAGISQIVHRFASNFKLSSIIQSTTNLQPFITEFTKFTCKCLNLLRATTDEDIANQVEQSFDILLEAWVVLTADNSINVQNYNNSNQHNNNNNNNSNNNGPQSFLKDYTSTVFQSYVETRLAIARRELLEGEEQEEIEDDEEDERHYEEQLQAITFLGRVDVLTAVKGLYGLIEARIGNLEQQSHTGIFIWPRDR